MTTIHDTIKALLNERGTCVERVASIDRELASVQSTVTDALAHLAPVAPAAPTVTRRGEIATGRSHDQARRTAALGVRFEREIKTALVAGPRSAINIAKTCGAKHKDIKSSLKRLFAAGTIEKIGARGPAVRWQLAGAMHSRPAVAAAVAAPDDEFEVVFPRRGNPKASPREAIEGART